jgi:hypothetical protein
MNARGTAALILVAMAGTAEAASAPEGLRGKSVIVTWRENRVQREAKAQQFRSLSFQHQFVLQVGSDGRATGRMTIVNPRGRSGSESDGANWRYDFGPQSLTVLMGGGTGGGARRIAVRFGKGLGTCTGDVIRGKVAGTSSMTASSFIHGGEVEIRSAHAVGVSCRVQ